MAKKLMEKVCLYFKVFGLGQYENGKLCYSGMKLTLGQSEKKVPYSEVQKKVLSIPDWKDEMLRFTRLDTVGIKPEAIELITPEEYDRDYRDSLKRLFYTAQKTNFKIGDDIVPFDGIYIDSRIQVSTAFNFYFTQNPAWSYHDGLGLTWTQIAATYTTWADWENVQKEVDDTAAITSVAELGAIAAFLNGETVTQSDLILNGFVIAGNASEQLYRFTPVSTIRNGNVITSVYYISQEYALALITYFKFYASNAAWIGGKAYNQHYTCSIDKSSTNPLGDYALTITKTDTIGSTPTMG